MRQQLGDGGSCAAYFAYLRRGQAATIRLCRAGSGAAAAVPASLAVWVAAAALVSLAVWAAAALAVELAAAARYLPVN